MIRVALWYDRPQEYTGGLNYMRNLLFALAAAGDPRIEPYIFFGHHVRDDVAKTFEPLAKVVRSPVLDRLSPAWFLHRILFRQFGSLWLVRREMSRRGISVISHAEHVHGRGGALRIISWIPDFQYLHLPELFPLDPERESARMLRIARESDALVLSSHAALQDFLSIAGGDAGPRTTVLPFVSQPAAAMASAAAAPRETLELRHGFRGRYFFLPNQFWEHKNHKVVFDAVALLKRQGVNVQLICTGNLRDYRVRHTAYVDGLRQRLEAEGLQSQVHILGMIEYTDVLALMRHSVATLNPSRFEGWSSTVEEARSMGKRLLLSDIPVHREQNPPQAQYFEPGDSESLARLLAWHWANSDDRISPEQASDAAQDLQRRTRHYGQAYARLVLEVAGVATTQREAP